ncbi:MAG: thioredoxin [Deltaproteobacteria bacterium]|nr:thioredoxin [Deltaproteobacteria bacterium]
MGKKGKPGYLKNSRPQDDRGGGSPLTQVSDASFEKEVVQSDIPVLVDFWAPWCGPCKMVGPVVEDLAREYQGRMKFVKMNTEKNQMVPGQMGIRSIPTLLIFKGRDVVAQRVGAAPREDLARMIDGVLKGKKPGLMSRIFG